MMDKWAADERKTLRSCEICGGGGVTRVIREGGETVTDVEGA